jgi:polyisoprenoid-binding protein YceI
VRGIRAKPKESAMTAQPATHISKLPETGEYRIDPERSRVTYASRHMFGLGRVSAEFRISSGRLDVSPALAECRARATIDAASFASGNRRRDQDVKGHSLLDVGAFQRIEFFSTGLKEEDGSVVLAGVVAMHNVETAVQVKVLSWESPATGVIHMAAQARHLDRHSFGITGSWGLVGRYFDLAFRIVAARAER